MDSRNTHTVSNEALRLIHDELVVTQAVFDRLGIPNDGQLSLSQRAKLLEDRLGHALRASREAEELFTALRKPR